jgi:hypothetical protein
MINMQSPETGFPLVAAAFKSEVGLLRNFDAMRLVTEFARQEPLVSDWTDPEAGAKVRAKWPVSPTVAYLAISRDETMIATFDEAGVLSLMTMTGKHFARKQLPVQNELAHTPMFSPDGTMIMLTVGIRVIVLKCPKPGDGVVELEVLGTRDVEQLAGTHFSPIACFRDDKLAFVPFGGARPGLALCTLPILTAVTKRAEGLVHGLAVSPNGAMLLINHRTHGNVYELDDKTQPGGWSPAGGFQITYPISYAEFSPDSAFVMTISPNNEIKLHAARPDAPYNDRVGLMYMSSLPYGTIWVGNNMLASVTTSRAKILMRNPREIDDRGIVDVGSVVHVMAYAPKSEKLITAGDGVLKVLSPWFKKPKLITSRLTGAMLLAGFRAYEIH